MDIKKQLKKPIKDWILYSLIGYAFSSAISITLAELFFLIGLVLWIIDVIKNKVPLKEQFSSPVTIPLMVFLLLHIVSAAAGIDPSNALKDLRKTWIILMFFLAANYAGREEDIKKTVKAFIAGAAVVGLYAIINTVYHRFGLHDVHFRASSFSGNHMHAGGMLMMACIVSAAALADKVKNDKRDIRGIMLYSGAFLIICGGLLFTYTRGSWLGAFAGVFLVAGYTDRRLVLAAVLVFIAAAFIMKDTSIAKRVMSGIKVQPGSSANERLHMWKSGMKMIKDRPIIGIGTANLEKIYPEYRMPEAVEMNAGHLHNNFIQLAVIDGIPGMLAFLWIFISLWASYMRGLSGVKPGFLKATGFSVLCVSIAFFINGFFEYNLFSSQPALMFWFLTGMGWGIFKLKTDN